MNGGGDHNHDMPGMSGGMGGGGSHHKMMKMMHMTFFWGKNSEILFSGWPGTRGGMYALALVFVLVLAIIVEWLSHCKWIKSGTHSVAAGLVQTLLYGLRVGLALLLMLAVMSFNVGVFLAALAGHTLGFLLFGSRVFKDKKEPLYEKSSDLPPMSC